VTKNSKTFTAARVLLVRLADQLNAEAKADPRLAKTRTRCNKLVAALDMALKKYEVVHGRKVPAKIKERKAGVPKKVAKKRVAKKRIVIGDNVVDIKTAAAARKKVHVKRSK
jgi:hypothetical protein